MQNFMIIHINNQSVVLPEGSVLAVLATELELPAQGVAIAVNNRMVPRMGWESHPLADGDRVTVIKAACGG